ncbi:hypothetical protein [Streptomyces sp. NPDC059176]|uniref:hypothetical protein n=1 Tax=unclassified Streptomyces TaxID=2593676 RepID=UPI0036B8839D
MESREQQLKTPRAAGAAGVVFALLLTAAIVLVRVGLPQGADDVNAAVSPEAKKAVSAALGIVPFAGIFFLWFMGALRSLTGEREDKFIATVFLGSGLLFVASLFGAAAAAGGVLDTGRSSGQQSGVFGQHFAYTLMTTYAMRMAAVFTFATSAIGRRLGVLPRQLTVLGYIAGLILLFAGPSVPWSELVFPFWALMVSLYILRVGFRIQPDPDAGPDPVNAT